MKITRNNYQIYALDYIEDNLGVIEKEMFRQFLSDNPDIKSEIETFQMIYVPVDETIKFSDHSRLLKSARVYSRRLLLWRSLAAVAAFSLLVILGKALYKTADTGVSDPVTASSGEMEQTPSLPLQDSGKEPVAEVGNMNSENIKPSADVPVYDQELSPGLPEIADRHVVATPVESSLSEEIVSIDRPVATSVQPLQTIPMRYNLLEPANVEEIPRDLVVIRGLEKTENGEKWLSWLAEKAILPAFVFDLDKERLKDALVPRYLVTD